MTGVASIHKEETPKFSEEQLAADSVMVRCGVEQPTYTALRNHMLRHGPDGILESAVHLEETQYDKLVAQAKKMRYNKASRKWQAV